MSREAILVVAHYDWDAAGDFNFNGDDVGPFSRFPTWYGFDNCPDNSQTWDEDQIAYNASEERHVKVNGKKVKQVALSFAEDDHGNNWDDKYSLAAYRVPIENLRFPTEPGTQGNPPEPADNEITITLRSSTIPGTVFEGRIQWIALYFRTVSPIVMVHGNKANAATWSETGDAGFDRAMGFAQRLDEMGWPIDGCGGPNPGEVEPCHHRIDLLPNDGSMRSHAQQLSTELKAIAKEFGVTALHVIGHSKGGLDMREYLATGYRQDRDKLRIATLTTLDTPHDGSVLADVGKALADAVDWKLALAPVVPSLPYPVRSKLENMLQFADSAALSELQTSRSATWNEDNIKNLPPDVRYGANTANASASGQMITSSHEIAAFLPTGLFAGFGWVEVGDFLYQMLGRHSSALPGKETICYGLVFVKCADVPVVVFQAPGSFLPNDLAVTERSAAGIDGGFAALAPATSWPTTNHGNIKRRGVAEYVAVKKLVTFEAQNQAGGLR